MRVLVITKDFPAPGLPEHGIVTLRHARVLADIGHEILVARVVPYAPPLTAKWRGYRSIPETYVMEGIRVRSFRAIFAPRMAAMEYLPLQVGAGLRRLVADFKPDVVHAHCLLPSAQLAAGLDVPTVVTAHGSDAYDWPWRRPGLTRAARQGIVSAAAVVAVSDFIRQRVRALFERDVEVIYNGADDNIFFPSDCRSARADLGIEQDRFVIAFAGGPPKIKGVFDLIAAAAQLRDVRPLVLFAGGEDHRTAVLQDAARASVDARYCGMLDHPQLARVLAASNVFCLPSYREGLPLVICEAMLSGRPIVATPVGGIPEIVTDGTHGRLVPPGDPDALSRALRNVAENPGRAIAMGDAAHRFAAHRLTWRSNVDRYSDIYGRICRSGSFHRVSARS
jgi:glycosyltransferase involved in cell wall biosynthesis